LRLAGGFLKFTKGWISKRSTLSFCAGGYLPVSIAGGTDRKRATTASRIRPAARGFQYDPATANPGAFLVSNGKLFFSATDSYHGIELWRLDSASQLVQLSSLKRQGNDLLVSWSSPGGLTNVLQSSSGSSGDGVSNNFTDHSTPLVAPAGDMVTMTYLDIGGATNKPAKYYRVRIQ
jgi:uncharacterized membrane protein